MKKKILLFLGMFLFMFNVSALTFDVDITNIEDEGNNGTIGSITDIDLENRTINAYFQDIGDEVSFSITVTNTGDRAGTLRSIEFTGTNDKLEYTSDLPDGGLAINGNDTNKVTITAKVKEGAVNGTTSSVININYSYDEGSCPDGEILSDDESMCLCPEGMERNETGICVKPIKPTDCAKDEIYNETKKICEKKVVPVNPSNPKTLDNIILVTLLFMVSGLGIYAVMFKKLKTNKKKVAAGIITGVVTLSLSFTVLASVFGLDKLLAAIINPITKSKTLTLTVNEEFDLIETWDGECSLEVSELTPDKIFQGGSGTESDPYQIKTAEQLSCLAKSVNNGTTYEGKYIEQIKNIKLNDHLNEQTGTIDFSDANPWTSIGYYAYNVDTQVEDKKAFSGTYDGGNHIISGLYISDYGSSDQQGLFGCAEDANLKNLIISDVCINTTKDAAALLGKGFGSLNISGITTYGEIRSVESYSSKAGIIAVYLPLENKTLNIEDVENNIDIYSMASNTSGILATIASSEEGNIVIKNVTNNGYFVTGGNSGGIVGYVSSQLVAVTIENAVNNGNFASPNALTNSAGGIAGFFYPGTGEIKDSYNTGDYEHYPSRYSNSLGGLVGFVGNDAVITIDGCFNSGDITYNRMVNGVAMGPEINVNGMSPDEWSEIADYNSALFGGIIGQNGGITTIRNSYNTGDMTTFSAMAGGIIGNDWGSTLYIDNCYNLGDITAAGNIGGLIGLGGYSITNSYNKGILTQFASNEGYSVGGLVGNRSRNTAIISNSYNEGDLFINSKITRTYAAGICGYCHSVTNSYNRGNITSKYAPGVLAGIYSSSIETGVTNVYNSGNIKYENLAGSPGDQYTYALASGIGTYNGTAARANAYNLGNITMERNYDNFKEIMVAGINLTSNQPVDNCVNAGNITVNINTPYTTATTITVSGISYMENVYNSFNAGTLTINDSALDTPLSEDGYNHKLDIGEIVQRYGGHQTYNNKFNSNPDGHAVGSYPRDNVLSETLEVGTYTDDATPDILSIINGDNAFEIKTGETLPTLKVFNQ